MKIVKYLLGLFVTFLILASAGIYILSLWDIYFMSWNMLLKIAITGGIVFVVIFLIWIVKHLFFKKNI